MINVRRGVFETNSSSSHSVTIADSTWVPSEFKIVEDWDICDGEPTILVDLVGFCSWYDHETQNDKLAYLVEQIAYITDNYYALSWYGNEEEQREAKERLYDSEEFKELEDEICDHAGCKHIRIKEDSSGYIDHDSVCNTIEELKNYDLPGSYTSFVFGADSYVHFEHNG